ncbi:MAG: tRNA (N(6)-L-threonylcarbamoyladenosine(37)-C(2))-methylthiotransferase MtaB [Defluviitaleaceae bacterium]|nr:tRNA (N(6)-L-threonylcarbamoyladenosine(37)-C(2))-methylthiotransferase MtaB [Defluviitaleaceae bacterium]
MSRVAATTVGCKVNLYDTQDILEKFMAKGYEVVGFESVADVYIINTCSVTNLADKKSRQMVGRAKKANPAAIVVAMGCSTQVNPVKYQALGVDIIIGTANRGDIFAFIDAFKAGGRAYLQFVGDVLEKRPYEPQTVTSLENRTRSYLKIQDGCNNFCTYCIIPHARGLSRSRPFRDIMEEAHALVALGCKEIVVTGIHVASYGKDLDEDVSLLDVLRQLAEVKGLERIRLSSVEPNVVDDAFCEFIKSTPKFCGHLHLSLQSGSDEILRKMKRHYTTAEYARAVEDLRKVSPDMAITTDVIVGFPAEREENHLETVAFLKKLNLAGLHVFPYAAKEGTPAAAMKEQITKEVKTKRSKGLLALSEECQKSFYDSFVGKNMSVLVEERLENGMYSGKTTNYIPVCFESDRRDLINTICQIEIKNSDNSVLFGTL